MGCVMKTAPQSAGFSPSSAQPTIRSLRGAAVALPSAGRARALSATSEPVPARSDTLAPLPLDLQFRWFTRPRRILLILFSVWVINAIDLAFTVNESTRHMFVEMNPIAALLLNSTELLVAYKFIMVAFGSSILIALRRQRIAEISCWFLFAAHTFLAIRWSIYYAHLLETLNDPAIDHTLSAAQMLTP